MNRRSSRVYLLAFALLAMVGFQNCGRNGTSSSSDASLSKASAPPQPHNQPGGDQALWASAEITPHTQANDDLTYWTVEPSGWQGAGSAPTSLPLVILNHGWGSNQADQYKKWLIHLARQGNVVVFPKFQNTLTLPMFFTDNAMKSVRMAIDSGFAKIQPDVHLGMTIVSYSAGGLVSANMANRYASLNLPKPVALIAIFPWNDSTLDASLASIPASTVLVCLVADEDQNVGRTGCDAIWDRTSQLGVRSYAWLFSDNHGVPALVANHYAVDESKSFNDPLNWYAFWKFADAGRDCGVYGSNCQNLAPDSPPAISMGSWSDGVPVHELQIKAVKIPCPSGSKALGCVTP